MKAYFSSEFFALRTPLLPFEDFLNLARGLTVPGLTGTASELDDAIACDRKLVRSSLRELVQRPEVKEALWLASPAFSDSLETWYTAPESENGQKLERTLYRYIARMTGRATPFGLFAGCSVGEIGAKTSLEIGPLKSYRRRSRLDMEYLCNLADQVSSDPGSRNALVCRPNTSLYFAARRYFHVQSYSKNGIQRYQLVATERSSYLAATLERAERGAVMAELAAQIAAGDPEISMEEAEDYIGQLVQSQVLVSDLFPPLTDREPIEEMIAQFRQARMPSLADSLRSVAERLRTLDEEGVGANLDHYHGLAAALSALPASFRPEHIVQVDTIKPAVLACLSSRLIDEIIEGVEVLRSIGARMLHDPLQDFRQEFQERYLDQEIPLVLALDEEVGIGFEHGSRAGTLAEPLLQDIDFQSQAEFSQPRSKRLNPVLLRKVGELQHLKGHVLSLDPALLSTLRIENPLPLPAAFSVMGTVCQKGAENGRGEDSFYLQAIAGPSGANFLGRFCSADEQLARRVREHLRSEEDATDGNAIFAEIVHLPEGRAGNVLYRPALRSYEIPFLARSGVAPERQIAVADLMVSVQQGRVVLRSRRLGCEVLPRLTTAHNFTHPSNLKLYSFLCLLQTQSIAPGLAWNWGLLQEAGFLPRVVMGNIVFSLARWLLTKETIEWLSAHVGRERLRRVQDWRQRNNLPRFVFLTETDNQLLIDFDNVLSVETFVEYVKKLPEARLTEMFPGPDALCANGPEGTFVNEVIIPFVQHAAPACEPRSGPEPTAELPAGSGSERPAARMGPGLEQRTFVPGSEWLFAKIYTSPVGADQILLEVIQPLLSMIRAENATDHWFFLRYGDPHWHLRVRFHGDPRKLTGYVLPELQSLLASHMRDGIAWRLQFDTYEREIERYGGAAGIRLAEQIFHLDSELCLQLLSTISDSLGTKVRWYLAFCSIDHILTAMGLDLKQKHGLIKGLARSYEKTLRIPEKYRTQVAERFRNERRTLSLLLEEPTASNLIPREAQLMISEFGQRCCSIAQELETARRRNDLSRSIQELAGSYIHMHMNRLCRSAQNAQEMVLYELLARTYDSKLARRKSSVAGKTI
jgi:thiopeptide-type bacteriocin biosynthesis protein